MGPADAVPDTGRASGRLTITLRVSGFVRRTRSMPQWHDS